jgi:hypothetical protein
VVSKHLKLFHVIIYFFPLVKKNVATALFSFFFLFLQSAMQLMTQTQVMRLRTLESVVARNICADSRHKAFTGLVDKRANALIVV